MRYCRKCIPEEMQRTAYFKSLHEYIANLDDELKVEDSRYEERLRICESCEKLTDGMCKGCGCFVELRGIMKKNHCPYDHW